MQSAGRLPDLPATRTTLVSVSALAVGIVVEPQAQGSAEMPGGRAGPHTTHEWEE